MLKGKKEPEQRFEIKQFYRENFTSNRQGEHAYGISARFTWHCDKANQFAPAPRLFFQRQLNRACPGKCFQIIVSRHSVAAAPPCLTARGPQSDPIQQLTLFFNICDRPQAPSRIGGELV